MDDLYLGRNIAQDDGTRRYKGGRDTGDGALLHAWEYVVRPCRDGNQRRIQPSFRQGAVGAIAAQGNHRAAGCLSHGRRRAGRIVGIAVAGPGDRRTGNPRRRYGAVGDAPVVIEVQDRGVRIRGGDAGKTACDNGALFLVVEHRRAGSDSADVLAGIGIRRQADKAAHAR